MGARAGDEEAGVGDFLDQPRHRLQRQLESLLVDEAADQQDQLLVGSAGCRSRSRSSGSCSGRSSGSIPLVLDPGDRVRGFFNAWTRKEAIVKALGRGLSIPLDSFEVALRPDEPPAVLDWNVPGAAAGRWQLHHLEPRRGYVGALAFSRP